jgi:diguanylate cyclase (GGDEF)-like protein
MNVQHLRSLLATLIAALCLSASLNAHAAPEKLDALKAQLSTDKGRQSVNAIALVRAALKDKASLALADRLWLLARLSEELRRNKQYDEALVVARDGQAAASTPVERVRFGRLATLALHDALKDPAAIREYEKIAPLLADLARPDADNASKLAAANAWSTGGTVLMFLGQLPEAMDVLVRAMRIYDAMDDHPLEQIDCVNEIAMVHFRTGRLEEALREVDRSIKIAERAKLPDALSRTYLRKSHFLSTAGRVDEQYQALLSARTLAQAEKNDYNLAVIATNLADVALQKKDYVAALRYAEEALPLVEQSQDRESVLVCWINKGIALNRLGRPGGIALIQRAIDEFSKDPGNQRVAAEVQGVLAEEYGFNRDFEKAYAASIDFHKRSETVRKATDLKRIAETDARYQADKKQRQIELLEQDQHAQKRLQLLGILAGALGLLTIVILLISRIYLKRAYRSVSEMSLSDPLTGLRNRRYLATRIDEDLAQVERQRAAHERLHETEALHNADVVFMMIDMDHFKKVNDEHGHAAGDALLKQFSAILLQEVRDSDTVVRWGGEEFLIVAKQSSNAEIHLLAERVRARVAACNFDLGNGVMLRKTCSIGFASYPFPPEGKPRPRWEDVAALADQCLYAAKASGRDVWVGIVQRGQAGGVPAQLDVRLGVQDGLFDLQHSEGRTIAWPDGATR